MTASHTDAEVLQEIADILWPLKDPERGWSPDTIQDVADTLAHLRPGLRPWSSSCLAYHGWAENALACARQRRWYARTAFVMGTGPHEVIDQEDDTVDALWELTYGPEGDD